MTTSDTCSALRRSCQLHDAHVCYERMRCAPLCCPCEHVEGTEKEEERQKATPRYVHLCYTQRDASKLCTLSTLSKCYTWEAKSGPYLSICRFHRSYNTDVKVRTWSSLSMIGSPPV